MKNINLKARIRRNKLDKLAGVYFVDETSETVKRLNREGKKSFLGIEREDGVYTIIGEEYIYYLTRLGNESKIRLNDFLKLLTENTLKLGKTGYFEFINISDTDAIWLLNAETMNAIWNTVLLVNSIC